MMEVNKLKSLKIISILFLSFFLITSAFAEGDDEYTVLLMHLNADPFTDSSTVGAHGNADETADVDLDESVYQLGTGSAHFDGDSGFLSYIDSDDWTFGNGNFTLEFWVRFDDLTNQCYFLSQVSGDQWGFSKYKASSDNKLYFLASGDTGFIQYTMTNAWAGAAVDTFYHVALVRNGAVGLMFIDGVSQTLTADAAFGTITLDNVAAVLKIGERGTEYVDGFMDEIRISKGTARWTENFDVPTEEYNGAVAGQVIFVN